MTIEGPSPRRATAVDAVAERFMADAVALDPIDATHLGLLGGEDRLTDYSPDGHAARADLRRRTLRALAGVQPLDGVDRVTVAAMRERLQVALELYEQRLDAAELNNIASPVQGVRDVFDLSPTETDDDWRNLAARLAAVPASLAGYRAGLAEAAGHGVAAAARQIRVAAAQAEEFADDDGFFASIAGRASAGNGPQAATLADAVAAGARSAAAAYAELASWLRADLLPQGGQRDPVGRDAYPLRSRAHLGTTIDIDDTYAWGLSQVTAIEQQMAEVATEILPGSGGDAAGGVPEALEALDADPARWIEGAGPFRAWMQDLSDAAIANLADAHFDIPASIRPLACRIAPSTSGAIYYTGPTEDLSRPGQMWWAVPRGTTRFSTWREASTVYHEGVPGHHLQVAHAVLGRDRLNRWRRLGCWVSGHGEGWALYAERLMDELGYLADPGHRMGRLDAAALRASRVVVDIGVHCELPAPAEVGGGTWDAQKAWAYLRAHTRVPDATLRFELDRYLGWPGQAPAYAVGERVWLELREAARSRAGAGFDLATFHREALDLGSIGLDALREAMLAPPAAAAEQPGPPRGGARP